MAKQHLTDAIVRRLAAPTKGKVIYGDDDVVGFGCRITAAGARTYVLRYVTRGGRERTYTIGSAGDWTTVMARAEAKRLRRLIDAGGDPLGEIEDERAAPTVAELSDRFEQEHLPRKRPATGRDYRGLLDNHVRPHFGPHMKVADVTFSDIDALHHKVTKIGPYAANRTIAVVSKMFSLAVRWGMRETNPARGIEKNREYGRRRYLSADELARLVAALNAYSDQTTADVFRLLLLTGCRRGEALAARWGDVDLGEGKWSKPASSTKQKEAHEVPLSAPARQLLSDIRERQLGKHRALPEFVFPGHGSTGHVVEVKKSWRALSKAAGITGLRIHDLRHSYASTLASGGASLPLIGALLGHTNPATTARYAHLFHDPLREATERVGAVITNAGKPPADTLPFNKRGRP